MRPLRESCQECRFDPDGLAKLLAYDVECVMMQSFPSREERQESQERQRGTVTGTGPAWVDRHQCVFMVDLHGGIGDAQPQLVAHEAEGRGVVAFLVGEVAIAAELGGGPHAQLRGDIGKRLEDGALNLGEAGEGAFVGGADGQRKCKKA